MELHNDTAPNYQPLLLLRNESYPTYQLFAIAGGNGTPAESVFKIAILETMSWLRQRFRAFELPQELEMPDPSRYDDVEMSHFKSIYLNMGYKPEIIYLPENKIWTLQLTEPDLGTRPGEKNQTRAPVPGRLIETNITYKIVNDVVECGFRTIISEPIGTVTECEVFRLAFIKMLARNPKVGLRHYWPLSDKAHIIGNQSDIKKLKKWAADENRMLPIVMFIEYIPTVKKQTPLLVTAKEAISMPKDNSTVFSLSSRNIQYNKFIETDEYIETKIPFLPLDITDLTRYRMSLAQFFVLKASMIDEFISLTGQQIPNGGIYISEPKILGGDNKAFSYNEITRDGFLDELEYFIQNYPKKKPFKFDRCIFVPKARELESENILNNLQSKDDVIKYYKQVLREKDLKYNTGITEVRIQFDKEKSKLQKKIDDILEEKQKISDLLIKLKSDNKSILKDDYKKLCICRNRPKKLDDIFQWTERWFNDKIIFHERAKRMLRGCNIDIELDLLCDALEYLATEYWDELNGLICEEERNNLCSKYYDRPFEITPNSTLSIEMYSSAYKIKYYIGYKGKPKESPLNLHLKVGNTRGNLLRIYFLYDKDNHLIVIGSLPDHLPVATTK
ncbi:MAG: hypothetical protein AB9835_01730 [Eubacteriales bacterium]